MHYILALIGTGLRGFWIKVKNGTGSNCIKTFSVGVDGLQHICNRLIINTLPWTNAQYQQTIRLFS